MRGTDPASRGIIRIGWRDKSRIGFVLGIRIAWPRQSSASSADMRPLRKREDLHKNLVKPRVDIIEMKSRQNCVEFLFVATRSRRSSKHDRLNDADASRVNSPLTITADC